jgi:hypothetical protein
MCIRRKVVVADPESYDNDGWQDVQARADKQPTQDCVALNGRSNIKATVDSLCAQLGAVLAHKNVNTISALFSLMDENGDGAVSKNEFYNMCQKLELRVSPASVNLVGR